MATPAVNPGQELPPVSQPLAADPEVARLRASVEGQRSEIDRLKRMVTAPPAPVAQSGNQMSKADMDKEFYKDPIGASLAIAQRAAQEAVNAQSASGFDTLLQVARSEARGSDAAQQKLFDKYLPEIENAVAAAPAQYRTNVNVWRNAFNVIKGQHLDEIMADMQQSNQAADVNRAPAVHIRSGDGPAPSSPRPGQAAKGDQLSDAEKRVAGKLGMSEERYLAGKKHYEGQTDPQINPVGPSSWDPHITFSSADKQRRAREARRNKK